MLKENFIEYLEKAIQNTWDGNAFSDYNGKTMTYREVAGQILKFHLFFEKAGIKKGDKIALLGKNSTNWGVTYLSVITYGTVIVPILPDFRPDDVHHIVNHSDSVFLFAADYLFENLDPEKMPEVRGIMAISDCRFLHTHDKSLEETWARADEMYDAKYPEGITAETFRLPAISNAELGVINYTSGTTGFSKGVMLDLNTLAANIRFAHRHMDLDPGDAIVSFLPLAHTYGCAFEFLFPFTRGCHITFLTKTPSPQIITQAFKEIRPRLILSVPLVVEKIYKKNLLPVISKPHMKLLLAIPGINRILLNKIKQKLSEVFGGNFRELVIGGAAFNHDAEKFFRKMKFPFTVGYGMTECGPLISYSSWQTTRLGSCGKPVDTLEVTIDSNDPVREVGEIILRGENVMLGYYKNEEATREIIDGEGWLHTGDLGLMDEDKNLFIKGRSKSMLLGPSGKNIYPEEIESVINSKPGISESLVVDREGKMVALIYPDKDFMKERGLTPETMQSLLDQYRKEVNEELPGFMRVHRFELHMDDFEKTPKQSIKRFLYQ